MSASVSDSVPLIGIGAATGELGRLVVSHLAKQVPTSSIVALVRSPDKAKDLGVAAREADYTKPATLDKALDGVHTLLLISSNAVHPGQRVVEHINMIDAAQKTGVKHVVYTSILRGDKSTLNIAKEHAATEAVLKMSGLPYTILRNGWYNENYAGSIQRALHAGAWVGASGEGKISAASRRDYAEAAVTVLTKPHEHVNAIYELAGDESFTLTQAAAELSKQTGRTIPYSDLPEDAYAGVLVKVGLPEPLAKLLAQADVASRNGGLNDNSRTLSTLIGRPTTPIATTISQVLNALFYCACSAM